MNGAKDDADVLPLDNTTEEQIDEEQDEPKEDDVSSKRQSVLTEKGLGYQMQVKTQNYESAHRKAVKLSSQIDKKLSEEPKSPQTVVKDMYQKWLTCYELFLSSYDELTVLLNHSDKQQGVIKFDTRNSFLMNFKSAVESWFAQTSSSSQVGHSRSRHSRQSDEAMSQFGSTKSSSSSTGTSKSRSTVTSKSRSTVTSKASRSTVMSAKLEEAQKQAELSTKIDALKKKQQLQLAHIKLKLQEDQLDLETKLAVSQAKGKVLDKFDTACSIKSGNVIGDIVEKMDVKTDVGKYVETVTGTMKVHDVHADFDNDYVQEFDFDEHEQRVNTVDVPNIDNSINIHETSEHKTGTQEVNVSHVSAMHDMFRYLKRPTVDIKKFSGEPLEYNRFIRQFKTKIVTYCDSDDEKMNYLEQYTEGEAAKVVSGYSFLDATQGYMAAMKELGDRYGTKDVIAHAYIKRALEWEVIKPDKPKQLDNFAIFLCECENAVNNIDAIKVLEYSENMRKLVSKLPFRLHDKWRSMVVHRKDSCGLVTFHDLVQFVKFEAKKLTHHTYGSQALGEDKSPSTLKKRPDKPTVRSFATVASDAHNVSASKYGNKKPGVSEQTQDSNNNELPKLKYVAFEKPCIYCQNSLHSMEKCKQLEAQSYDDKIQYVKSKGLCYGCFKPGHRSNNCRYRATCAVCQRKHPTILHNESFVFKSATPVSSQTEGCVSNTIVALAQNETNDQLCTMAIIPVNVGVKNSSKILKTYAFMDPGSTVSFCTNDLMRQLGVQGHEKKITVNTMTSSQTVTSFVVKNLQLSDIKCENTIQLQKMYTSEKLPVEKYHIPTEKDLSHWPHLNGITVPHLDVPIGLLLGNNIPDAYTPLEVKSGPPGSPHATRTRIGWIPWNVIRQDILVSSMNVNRISVDEIGVIEEKNNMDLLNKLVIDAINADFPERVIDDKDESSVQDQMFLQKVNSSIQLINGHYEIGLPWKDESVMLPNNSNQAMKRLDCLKKKLLKNDKFFSDYKKFMDKIIAENYCEKVPTHELQRNDGKVWFIPHHGVYHPKKPEKIRVVFDCSAAYQGISLNTLLLQGPNLTNDLIGVLLRFRQEPIALMADIEAMYYQVRVPQDDTDSLRFFWWPSGNVNDKPVQYRMLVHLFGGISSATCANIALRRTALDNIDKYNPVVTNTILHNFYVDDCLKSVATPSVACQLIQDLTACCAESGFKLTKWIANRHDVLAAVPMEERSKEAKEIDLTYDDLPVERALGITWFTESDVFGFKITIKDHVCTKRGILSALSSLYDPLGFVSPFILSARIILQELCRCGLDWDTEITDDKLYRWRQWLQCLPQLEKVTVPRCIKPNNFRIQSYQIHTFSDASEHGYGAVAYMRMSDDQDQVKTSFLMAKARVAPLKQVTIPRMELTAAVIAVKMCIKVKSELEIPIDKMYFWTDSSSVLRYISNECARYKTFVANRVSLIREATDVQQWRFIPGTENPADIASRGVLSAENFTEDSLWFEGPLVLQQEESSWKHMPQTENREDDPEIKKVMIAATTEQNDVIDSMIHRASSLNKLKRTLGWILLFFHNIKVKVSTKNGDVSQETKVKEKPYLSVQTLQQAETMLIRHVQARHFGDEIDAIETGNKVNRTSQLRKLDVFLHDDILRVGGRIQQSGQPYDVIHPIVLPNVRLSVLIAEHFHKKGHLGKNAVLANIRQRYWILGISSIVKKCISKCVFCRKYTATSCNQKMADLPKDRITPDVPPFHNTGMDYFGPIEVKRGRAVVKRYGVIFTCLTSRAVHLEMASTLDTDSCINSIRRFTARRGPVKLIRSDNGTNLVGAQRELKEEISKWNQDKFHDLLHTEGIEWRFNPPYGSHFGGVWERLIRSVRKVLYSLVQQQMGKTMDDEALQTLFCEVEAILNGRPLTKTSSDPNDLEVLTPNHLLLLRAGYSLPPGIFQDSDNYCRRRWRQVQYLADMFWKRWVKEYIPLLQTRQKWFHPKRNLVNGDIVLLMDSSLRNSWSLGKVVEVTPDKKGLTRVVKVKTRNTVLTRPVDKLCLILECDQ